MRAVRNIRLCTKDCLCLYVCPTGATDTQTGQIDAVKCISGCRVCVDACPSHAISLVPEEYPPQQEKAHAVQAELRSLAASKVRAEQIASKAANISKDPAERQLAKAISMSNRLMAEDLLREAGYMLPQSQNVKALLQSLAEADQPEGFPKETVEQLLKTMNENN